MAAFPALSPINHSPRFLLEPMYFSWNTLLFLTLRKLETEGILVILWCYLSVLEK